MQCTCGDSHHGSTSAKQPYNHVLGHEFQTETGSEPVTLAEAKEHMNVTFTDDDAYITALITQVRQIFEEVLRVTIKQRSNASALQFQIGQRMELPFGPVLDVTFAADENGTSIAFEDLKLIDELPGGFWALKVKYDYIKLTYTSGWTVFPLGLKNAILREIAWRYQHRGDVVQDSDTIHVKEAYKYKRGSWLV